MKALKPADVITAVRVARSFVLEVTFADGLRKCIDVSNALTGPMFEPLLDEALFSQATVDAVLGTVVWPNGADLSPEFLRQAPAVES